MSKTDDNAILKALGQGNSIEQVCEQAGISRNAFDSWWDSQVKDRVPTSSGTRNVNIKESVEILRDERGIPHISAKSDADLFFGFGYAMAQDRLWQLDYLRRKAVGRLSEILGHDGLQLDIVARTVGLNRIAAKEVDALPSKTLGQLEAFSNGINAVIKESADNLPIEFALLQYEPEEWSVLDSVAIMGEFRWYLTGRLPVIVIPELARRALNDDGLFEAFLTPEAGDESILPKGSYPTNGKQFQGEVGEVVNDAMDGLGSNNWVVSGGRASKGAPMVASDPHIAFASVSCWYEAHLNSDSFNVAGAAYVGVPMIMFGRNQRVAWGLTNNICSQRDLYLEKVDSKHSGGFYFDGKWEPSKEIIEKIEVKGSETITKKVRYSRNGPIVDELLPEEARDIGPVSLKWIGENPGHEITSLLSANQANSAQEFRDALNDWWIPTWSFVFADVDGHIGYQCAGKIPIREDWKRGYRPGWEPEQQWKEFIPFESMPALSDPERGWITTANNRTAPEDYPYPLSGTWSSGQRAQRIRQMIEGKDKLSREDFTNMQLDSLSLRAVEGVPPLVRVLASASDEKIREALAILEAWDGRMESDEAGACIFEIFFQKWARRVVSERFSEDAVALMSGAASGLALALLSEESNGWFANGERNAAISSTFMQTLSDLEEQLGPDMSNWTWGRIHKINLRHVLSDRGKLGELLNRGGQPVRGSGITVCNTGYDPNYLATMGANYRLTADLSEEPQVLWAVDAAGESGHPGSPHYCGQLDEWLSNKQHPIPLDVNDEHFGIKEKLKLLPS